MLHLSEFAPGSRVTAVKKPDYSLSGRITVSAGKVCKTVENGKLEVCDRAFFLDGKPILLLGAKKSIRGEFELKSGLIRVGSQVLRPSSQLRRAIEQLDGAKGDVSGDDREKAFLRNSRESR